MSSFEFELLGRQSSSNLFTYRMKKFQIDIDLRINPTPPRLDSFALVGCQGAPETSLNEDRPPPSPERGLAKQEHNADRCGTFISTPTTGDRFHSWRASFFPTLGSHLEVLKTNLNYHLCVFNIMNCRHMLEMNRGD